jgi:hypothetical protein
MKELEPRPETPEEQVPHKGSSLLVLYGFLALALAAAIGVALMIVLPFYHRR